MSVTSGGVVRLLFEAPRAVDLFKQRRQQIFWQARCAASCARNYSFVRARREVLELSDLPRSFLRSGFSSRRRAQLTFSSNDVSKAFSKLDAPHLVARNHSFVRARREPLDDQVNLGHGVYLDPPPLFRSSDVKNYQYQIYNIDLKSKHLLFIKSNRA